MGFAPICVVFGCLQISSQVKHILLHSGGSKPQFVRGFHLWTGAAKVAAASLREEVQLAGLRLREQVGLNVVALHIHHLQPAATVVLKCAKFKLNGNYISYVKYRSLLRRSAT